jgi:Rieske Fe-S protein
VTTSDPATQRGSSRAVGPGGGRTFDPSRRGLLTAGAAGVAAAAGFVAMRAWEAGEDATAGTRSDYDAGGGGTVVALADVPVGGGVVLQAQQVVVTRDAQGEVHAFSAVCTHQRCLVSGVADGAISCPCHGSLFDAVTGEVVRGPATAPLPAVPAAVAGDDVVVG